MKENVKPIENALDKITKLRGVTFNWKDKKKYNNRTNIGIVAQEIEETIPEVVFSEEGENGTKSVAYNKLTAVLIEAVKELKAENDNLKTENDLLEKRLSMVEERLR